MMHRMTTWVAALLLVFLVVPLAAQDPPDALAAYFDGNYEDAVQITLAELETQPRNMNSYSVLGWSLIALGRYEEALDYGLRALGIARADIRIIELVAEAYYYTGELLTALAYFEEYAALAPTGERIGVTYYFMGRIFIDLGEFNHADIALSTATYHNPNNAAWWERLGYAREMAEDFPFSEAAYDRALELNPSYTAAIRGKERIQEKLGG
jgi:tetratricopeptide (TPR) repeat protein